MGSSIGADRIRGRVGAVALAVGVGTAIASAQAVAHADTTGPGTDSGSASPTGTSAGPRSGAAAVGTWSAVRRCSGGLCSLLRICM